MQDDVILAMVGWLWAREFNPVSELVTSREAWSKESRHMAAGRVERDCWIGRDKTRSGPGGAPYLLPWHMTNFSLLIIHAHSRSVSRVSLGTGASFSISCKCVAIQDRGQQQLSKVHPPPHKMSPAPHTVQFALCTKTSGLVHTMAHRKYYPPAYNTLPSNPYPGQLTLGSFASRGPPCPQKIAKMLGGLATPPGTWHGSLLIKKLHLPSRWHVSASFSSQNSSPMGQP